MAQNNFELSINANIKNVWLALTNSYEFSKWMPNVKVKTNWIEGSQINYTCYDTNGNVIKWDNKEMIWDGIIETIKEDKELTCIYPSKSTGLEKESYLLEKISENETKLIQVQTLTSQEIADGYKDGTSQVLQFLKSYLENK
jgi:uncharacterized protein YndB with AHSA1/START domain